MKVQLACLDDLLELKAMYRKIVEHMRQNGIDIWDEIYPCEFLKDDIESQCLYKLVCHHQIVAAFALYNTHEAGHAVEWENPHEKAVYIDRLGVNVHFLKQGLASQALSGALLLAKEKKAQYLRLFVVDINEPAIGLYLKNGFKRVPGVYDEKIDDDLILHEYGFERGINE